MPNRFLSQVEHEELFAPLFADVRATLEKASGGDSELLWALRRKLAKELTYLERGKPMQRRALKIRKRAEQGGLCANCCKPLPEEAELDRTEAMLGYTMENTRLVCHACHRTLQRERGFA